MTSPTDAGFRRGIRIGVDVGSVRVGVSRTDPDGLIAVPVATLDRPKAVAAPRTDLLGVAALVAEHEPLEVVVGLPVALDGSEGLAAAGVRAWVGDLHRVLAQRGTPVPVRLVDERMTTAAVTKELRAAGRDARSSRAVVDQAAAVMIVQHALDAERATGAPPGALAEPPEDLA
ncbi:MAG: Holliday junction resolvase RuvX [Candidatus Nanopelagicales bacterium]